MELQELLFTTIYQKTCRNIKNSVLSTLKPQHMVNLANIASLEIAAILILRTS